MNPRAQIGHTIHDVRHGLRTFRRRPGFTLVVLATLAVGIGASTAIFTVVNGVLLSPLPYRQPERLARLFGSWAHGAREGLSPPDFADYRARGTAFESLAAVSNTTPLVSLKGEGEPEQVRARNVTSGFFRTLGVDPLLGREFTTSEEAWRGPKVVVLSNGFWQRELGADPGVVGKPLLVNGVAHTVVGVLPRFLDVFGSTEIFLPVQANPVPEMRGIRTLIVLGRLRAGTDLAQAQRELDLLSRGLASEHPRFDAGWSVRAVPLGEDVVAGSKAGLLLLLGAVGLFVLLVSANVASLMLALAAARHGEIFTRLALGASHGRVARQLITESLTLAVVGGGAGAAVGAAAVDVIKRLGPAGIPRLAEVSIDFRALSFTVAVSLAVGVLFGLEPALRSLRLNLADALKGAARVVTGSGRLREALVVFQMATSLALLIGAGLLVRSLIELGDVDPGFRASDLVTTRLAVPGSRYADGTGAKLSAFWRSALHQVAAIPGVAGAALTSELPLGGLENPTPRMVRTGAGKSALLHLRSVSPEYREVMGIPLVAGRFISPDDRRETHRTVAISEELRRDLFGDENPLGQVLRFNFRERSETEDYAAVVVGVVRGVRHANLAAAPFREAYLPLSQSPLTGYDLIVRTTASPAALAGPLRAAIESLDPTQSIGPVRTVSAVVASGLTESRFRGVILGLFAAVSLLLAAGGLYGALTFIVSQRTREVGIRVALGAAPGAIAALVVRRGLMLCGIGLLVGLSASLALTRLLSALMYGVGVADPVTFLVAPSVLLVVGLIASLVPSWRAMKLDPLVALRSD